MSLKLKVVFIGDSFVGKTAVMRRFLGEMFDPTFIMTPSGGLYDAVTLFKPIGLPFVVPLHIEKSLRFVSKQSKMFCKY